MSMFTLAISGLTTSNSSWFMDLFLCNIFPYTSYFTFTTRHIHNQVSFLLRLTLFNLLELFSALAPQYIGHLLTSEANLSVSYLFAFSYCSTILQLKWINKREWTEGVSGSRALWDHTVSCLILLRVKLTLWSHWTGTYSLPPSDPVTETLLLSLLFEPCCGFQGTK